MAKSLKDELKSTKKRSNKRLIAVRLPEEMVIELERLAKDTGQTLTTVVTVALQRCLKAPKD